MIITTTGLYSIASFILFWHASLEVVMLTPILKHQDKIPVYEQLYRYIRGEIERGTLTKGQRLPSKRKFSAHLKISQSTIENAYAQLSAEGYIYSLPKRGYFVNEFSGYHINSFPSVPPDSSLEPPHEQSSCQFDLRTNAVDTQHFPFSVWAKLMRECLSENSHDLLRAADPQGNLSLRQEIVRYLHDFRGIEAHPSQIFLGAGSEYLLGLITQLLGRDSIYAVEDPGYPKTARILNANGLKTVFVPLDQNGIDINALSSCSANVLHVTPSHHFPLGIVTPIGRRQSLLDWAGKGDKRYVIEDDYDSEFRFSGRPIPALQSLDTNERVIYMNTFAKTLAPSLRISYMVLPPHLVQRFHHELYFYSCTIPSFEQETLNKFLNRGYFERHLSRMRGRYKLCRDTFISHLTKNMPKPLIKMNGQDSGLHLLLTVQNEMDEQLLVSSAWEKGVRVYGLSSYYHESCTSSIPPTVVVGYSGYQPKELAEVAHLLQAAWFENKSK